jgi:hypothetical protein
MAVTAIPRLALATLRGIRPLIRPGDTGTGIVHLGLGAFHRAIGRCTATRRSGARPEPRPA